jgi:uncharacterized repeat protein (TIGR02543 family)
VADFPADPSRSGYAFTSWNTQANGGGSPFTASTTVSGDITVYAQWTEAAPGSYTVTFALNDGTGTIYATKTVTPPADSIGSGAFPGNPSRSGYNFGSWNTQADGGGSVFTASTTVDSSITVYALWNSYSYTVTFDTNGGDTEANPTTKIVASPAATIDALPTPPTRTANYGFVGWNTAANGSGTSFTAATTVSGNITVYALWTKTTITFNPDAGEDALSQGNFTLSKTETGNPASQTLTITGTGYTDPRWLVDGSLKGTGTTITLSAAAYHLGGHSLTLVITKGGATWSKDITFTVTN